MRLKTRPSWFAQTSSTISLLLVLAFLLSLCPPACAKSAAPRAATGTFATETEIVHWSAIYGGPSADWARSIAPTADGGFIMAGRTRSLGAGRADFYLVKTDTAGHVAVAEPKPSPPCVSSLSLTCEPNPFRTMTAISLQLTANSPTQLRVFDASGRCVRTLTANRTSYAIWDGTDELDHALPSGTYFIRCDAARERASVRLVLQR